MCIFYTVFVCVTLAVNRHYSACCLLQSIFQSLCDVEVTLIPTDTRMPCSEVVSTSLFETFLHAVILPSHRQHDGAVAGFFSVCD